MLYRKISSLIEEHLKSDTNKILLIDGARQVGKTYIVRHVGILSGILYGSLSVVPIKVKSGKDYTIHSALNAFVQNEEYHIKKAVVLSNEREITHKGKITYMPIYDIMFF